MTEMTVRADVGNNVYPDPEYPVALLESEGYKPVIESKPPVPEKGFHYDLTFTDTGTEIIFTWVLVEDDPSAEDLFKILKIALLCVLLSLLVYLINRHFLFRFLLQLYLTF